MRLMALAMLAAGSFIFTAGDSMAAEEIDLTGVEWKQIRGDTKYAINVSFNNLSALTEIQVSSSVVSADGYGGAITQLDAAHLRGKRVALSARMSSSGDAMNPALWMRIDGIQGRLRFATSSDQPITKGISEERTISLVVPDEAASMSLGVVMGGHGWVKASEISLRSAESSIEDIDAHDVLDAAVQKAKEYSILSAGVDWASVVKDLDATIADSEHPSSAYPVIWKLIDVLSDHHAMLYPPKKAEEFRSSGRSSAPAEVELLPGGIGYILLPGFTGANPRDAEDFANQVSEKIEVISGDADKGWILDLRQNTGGNMWPMLCALKPLLGEDYVGSFERRDGTRVPWRAGDHIDDCKPRVILTKKRVALLYGEKTNSSGEAVAVAFRGRPGTKSFGQATAGKSTATSSFKLPDGGLFFLTTSIDVDRTGKKFGGRIFPDEPTSESDALQGALGWLTEDVE